MRWATQWRGSAMPPGSDRAELVAAARIAFTELGAGADLDDIACHAGCDARALRRHFGDRDTLVTAVLDDLTESLWASDEFDAGVRDTAPGVRLPRVSAKQVVPSVAAIAALLPLGVAPASAAALDPAPAPGSTVLTVSPLWPVVPLDGALRGSLCEDSCQAVRYMPFFTAGGAEALQRELTDVGTAKPSGADPTVVFAFSNGALVAQRWMAEHAGQAGAPTADELSFVFVGNPRRAYGGSMPALPPTDYHVVDVVRQYDPLADFPDHPFNLLALANVAAGIFSPEHLNYTQVDLDDPNNVVWTEGTTTYVFVPTENLPLLAPLRLLGMKKLADELNDPLKAIIEKAYDRPYLATAEPAPEPEAVSASAVIEPAVTPSATAAAADVAAGEATPSTGRHRLTLGRHAIADTDTDTDTAGGSTTDSDTAGVTTPSPESTDPARVTEPAGTTDPGSTAGSGATSTNQKTSETSISGRTSGAGASDASDTAGAKATARARAPQRDAATRPGRHRVNSQD